MRKRTICCAAAALALLLALTVCGCAASETAAESAKEKTGLTVTDARGKVIELGAPAKSVVALSASDCEILYAVGAGETLIARGQYCDWPEEVKAAPVLQTGADINTERILALRPDAVLLRTMEHTDAQIAALEKAGLKVVVTDAQNIEQVYSTIRLIGGVTGHAQQAETVAAGMHSVFEKIKQTPVEGEKTVYFEVSPLEYGLWTAGKNTFMNEIAELMGLKNCFDELDGWVEVSQEQVISRNPDYIVTIAMYFGEGAPPADEIMSRAGWSGVTAVKNKKVLNLQNNELSRPGPRLAEGARLLYDFCS